MSKKVGKLSVLLAAAVLILLSSCNPVPYRTGYYTSPVWSDNDSRIAYINLSFTEWSFLAFDSPSRYNPEFKIRTIKPDKTGETATGVTIEAWPEELFYSTSENYAVYSYYNESISKIDILRISTGTVETLVENATPPSLDHIRVVPSPDTSVLAKITPLPWCEVHQAFDNSCTFEEIWQDQPGEVYTPVPYRVKISFLSSDSLAEISSYQRDFPGTFSYRWDTDGSFILVDEESWEETTKERNGFRITPSNGVDQLITIPSDFTIWPETTSSDISSDGTLIYFEEKELVKSEAMAEYSTSPFVNQD